MRSKYWGFLIGGLLILSAGLSLFLFRPREAAAFARVTSFGSEVCTVSLMADQEFTVLTPEGGFNTITVRDSAIAVTAASCPDGYCMQRGFCNQGTQIVCLPNHLIISFTGGAPTVDAIAG